MRDCRQEQLTEMMNRISAASTKLNEVNQLPGND